MKLEISVRKGGISEIPDVAFKRLGILLTSIVYVCAWPSERSKRRTKYEKKEIQLQTNRRRENTFALEAIFGNPLKSAGHHSPT